MLGRHGHFQDHLQLDAYSVAPFHMLVILAWLGLLLSNHVPHFQTASFQDILVREGDGDVQGLLVAQSAGHYHRIVFSNRSGG